MQKKPITIADIVRIFGECEIQDERGIWMPITTNYKKDLFDIKVQRKETNQNFSKDHAYGKKGEEAIRAMIEDGETIEVKTERGIWKTSNNVAIEFQKIDTKELSGISITKADWWFCVLDNGEKDSLKNCAGFFYSVKKLKDKIRPSVKDWLDEKRPKYRVVPGGDDNNSRMVLLPILELFKEEDKKQEELFT